MVGAKAFDFYALSWGVPRKPACNLVETAQRKSQLNKKLLPPSPSETVRNVDTNGYHAGNQMDTTGGNQASDVDNNFGNNGYQSDTNTHK
jgi:hypothetical protein